MSEATDPTRSMIEADLARITRRGDAHLRRFLADVPDPREYAYRLPEFDAVPLMSATLRHSCRIVSAEVAKLLRPLGLVDYASTHLTAFGAAVYRELTAGDDA